MQTTWKAWNEANNQPPLWRKGGNDRHQFQYADYDWLKGTVHYKAHVQ